MLLGANASYFYNIAGGGPSGAAGPVLVAAGGAPEFAGLNNTGGAMAVDLADTTLSFQVAVPFTFDPNVVLTFTFTGATETFNTVTLTAGTFTAGYQSSDATIVGGAVRFDVSGWNMPIGVFTFTLSTFVPSPPPTDAAGPPAPSNYYPSLHANFDYLLRYYTFGRIPPLPDTVTTPEGKSLPNPLIAAEAQVRLLADQVNAGTLSYQAALDRFVDLADGTTTVAVMTYGFFTGRIPTRDGLDYLVSSPLNDRDLNDGFYAGMSLENRYINFAVNLGKVGEGRASFQANYGSLSLTDATAKAYAEIFGTTPSAQKLADILTPTRVSYLTTMGGDALGAKAAMVGFLLGEAAKSDIGRYSVMTENFLYDLVDGIAGYGSPLVDYWNAGPRYNGLLGEVLG